MSSCKATNAKLTRPEAEQLLREAGLSEGHVQAVLDRPFTLDLSRIDSLEPHLRAKAARVRAIVAAYAVHLVEVSS